jgi:glycosyltransferase involved in cell wall biosynthesis
VKNLPLVSIIVSVKNEAELVRHAIADLLNQTYSEIEIIIFEDGSDAETKKAIREFTDPRIILLGSRSSIGQAAARNEAISTAKGAFIAIADADDRYDAHRIEMQADYLEIHPHVDILGSNFTVNEGNYSWDIYYNHYNIYHQFLINNPIIHSSIFFRSELIENGFKYRPAYASGGDYAEDYDLFARHRNQWIFHNLSSRLVQYHIRQDKAPLQDDQKSRVRMVREKILLEYIKKASESDILFHHQFCELQSGLNYYDIEKWIYRLCRTQPKRSMIYRDLKRILYRHLWHYLRVCKPACSNKDKIKILYYSRQNPAYFFKSVIKIIIRKAL